MNESVIPRSQFLQIRPALVALFTAKSNTLFKYTVAENAGLPAGRVRLDLPHNNKYHSSVYNTTAPP